MPPLASTSKERGQRLSDRLRVLLSLKRSSLLSDDLSLIFLAFRSPPATVFALPSADGEIEHTSCVTLAHLILLAAYPPALTPSSTSLRALASHLEQRLTTRDDVNLEEAFGAFSALLKVSPPVGVSLFIGSPSPGALQQRLEEAVSYVVEGGSRKARMALVYMLGQTATHAATRKLVQEQVGEWLESFLRIDEIDGKEEDEDRMRAMAGLAVVKLLLGAASTSGDGVVGQESTSARTIWSVQDLIILFRDMAIQASERVQLRHHHDGDTLSTSLEALTFLLHSSSADQKALLCTTGFLRSLFSILPSLTSAPASSAATRASDGGISFSVASIIASVVAYPAVESPGSSAEQLRRLKAFASPKSAAATTLPAESSSSVDARISRILSINPSPLPSLVYLAQASSAQIRHKSAAAFLALSQQSKHRGQLLQGGAAKALLRILRQVVLPLANEDVSSIQALAKLLITTAPLLVLGPTEKSPFLSEAVDALVVPLAISDTGDEPVVGLLLVQFECLMALTNLASLEGETSERMAAKVVRSGKEREGGAEKGRALLSVVEELILNQNELVCRAATQLFCNLVATTAGEDYFVPSSNSDSHLSSSSTVKEDASAEDRTPDSSRLKLLLTLASSSMPDIPTRLAASGALASLLSSPRSDIVAALACRIGRKEDSMRKMLDLVELDGNGDARLMTSERTGLRHRGLVILHAIVHAVQDMEGCREVLVTFERVELARRLRRMIALEEVEEFKEIGSSALVQIDDLIAINL